MNPVRLPASLAASLAAILAAAVLLSGCAAAGDWRLVHPFGKKDDIVIARGGASLRLIPPVMPPEEDLDEDTEIPRIGLVAQFAGRAPFAVAPIDTVGDTYGYSVGIGRLSPGDSSPAIVIAGYTGGMHCCHTMQVVTLSRGVEKIAVLPLRDGESEEGFPRDLDGDGTADFLRPDGRFNYAFTAYAFSVAPPRYFNVIDGEARDVSTAPRYAPLYRKFAVAMRKECTSGQGNRAGTCVAYAAAMARLGEDEAGIAFAAAATERSDWYPYSCTVATDDEGVCPEGKEREFASFEEALRWFLADTGWTAP